MAEKMLPQKCIPRANGWQGMFEHPFDKPLAGQAVNGNTGKAKNFAILLDTPLIQVTISKSPEIKFSDGKVIFGITITAR